MLRRHHGSLLWLTFERFRPSILGSLSGDVFERRTSNGSGLFPLLTPDFYNKFLGKSSRHITNEKSPLPVDMASLWKRRWLNSLLSHQQRKLLFHAILVLFFSYHRPSPLLNCQNTGYRKPWIWLYVCPQLSFGRFMYVCSSDQVYPALNKYLSVYKTFVFSRPH